MNSLLYRGFTLSPSLRKGHYRIYYLENRMPTIPMTQNQCIEYIDKNWNKLKPEIIQAEEDYKLNQKENE